MFSLSKKRGFTFIELLVVIAIIGILSSVVLASINSSRKKSRDARRISDIKQIQLALELYFNENRYYPDSLDDLVTDGYLPAKPKDPSGGATCTSDVVTDRCNYGYVYSPDSNPAYYHLGADLEQYNSILESDKDCNSVTLDSCSSDSGYTGNTFDGSSESSPNYIYDVAEE